MMSDITKLTPLEKGKAIGLVGKGGAGKTALIKSLYKESEKEWQGNVLYLPSPSRLRISSPFFTVRERRDMDEMKEEIEFLEERIESFLNVSSSRETLGILHTFLRNGVITKNSLLLIDSFDSLSDTTDLTLTSALINLLLKKEVSVLVTLSSIVGARIMEREIERVEFYSLKKRERAEKKRSEEIYSLLLQDLEDL